LIPQRIPESRTHVDALFLSIAQLSSSQDSLVKEATDLLERFVSREHKIYSAVTAFQLYCSETLHKVNEEASQIRSTAKLETAAWEAEKAKLSAIKNFEGKIRLDVGGHRFTTSLTTLRRFPDTMIGAMFSGRHAFHLDEEGYYFIDRDGTHFRHILNFLRSPEAFVCELTGAGLKELKNECDYYGVLDKMFPFVPIPAFACNNLRGQMVTVSQNVSGMWSVNNQPLKICTHCFRADYSHCGVAGQSHGYTYFANFHATLQARGGAIDWSVQPKPSPTCAGCGRAHI